MKSVYRVLWLSSYISIGCEEPLSFYHGTKNVGYNFLLYMGLYGGFMEGIVRCAGNLSVYIILALSKHKNSFGKNIYCLHGQFGLY